MSNDDKKPLVWDTYKLGRATYLTNDYADSPEIRDARAAFAKQVSGQFDSIFVHGDKPKPPQEKRLAFYSKAFDGVWDYIGLDMRQTLSEDDYIIVGNQAQVLAEYRRIKHTLHCAVTRIRKGFWRFEYAGHEHHLAYWEFHKADYAIYGRIVKPEWKFKIDWSLK